MEKQITLSISELEAIFKAGIEYENQCWEVAYGERDEIDALDFDEYMKEVHNIEI
jgi:hypothetical protein